MEWNKECGYRPWQPSGLELVSNSSRHSLEDPGSNPTHGAIFTEEIIKKISSN